MLEKKKNFNFLGASFLAPKSGHRREKQPVLGLGNINTRKRCEICSELTTKSPERRH